jgi:hypothetical protein
MHEMDGKAAMPNQPAKGSPFDPFLSGFLTAVREFTGGYSLQSHGAKIARQLDVDPAFVEALTTSARRRSLIEPFYPPSNRHAIRWRVSARGERFLATLEAPESVSD